MKPITVALIDDHPLVVDGLTRVFEQDGDFKVVAKGVSADEAVILAEQHLPAIVLMDLSMPGDAFEAITEIVRAPAEAKVVVFTAFPNIDLALRALEAGASGYILKGSPAHELLRGVRAVHQGETYITEGFASKVITALRSAAVKAIASQPVKLGFREQQIVAHLVKGHTNKEIAADLGLSEQTVKRHMTLIMQKLHVRNRVEVAMVAQKLGGEKDPFGPTAVSR
ncbi:DNA-binding response regulator, NarL/FixJ family, contains REC and HTH domains [Mesorhizobium albiziae]|uniref:DNA-binding response regulator, NarL/FixJ family, contains REC and HTH domains n=1 Tax=Neomesorhizobium albiziae TaxID=335020 RepID=A0A1I4EQQ3_9HYPH|nr:response regulator transcription factor [Mesorhizobium albiziae]GLS31378.1 DNA-binding response regulator [Mesorhizobium albiziae]SFL06816.1 DNA-binding response regulator, NarL/FixJ family, contains REC and HTH domains [Mesorhizobium albiziae]